MFLFESVLNQTTKKYCRDYLRSSLGTRLLSCNCLVCIINKTYEGGGGNRGGGIGGG